MKNDPNIYKYMKQKLQSIKLPDGYAYGQALLNAVNENLRSVALPTVSNLDTLSNLLSYYTKKGILTPFLMHQGKQRSIQAFSKEHVTQLYIHARHRRKNGRVKTTDIWAELPPKYSQDPDWLPLSTIAARLKVSRQRVKNFAKESTKIKIFLDPKTKRKLANINDMKECLQWRSRQWLIKHVSAEELEVIKHTAERKLVHTPCIPMAYYRCPQFAHL